MHARTPIPEAEPAPARFVVVGVGSNVRRMASISIALDHLSRCFGTLWVSRFVETAPVGMTDGSGPFLNGAVGLLTALDRRALKAVLVDLERITGRDREHPHRRTRARPLDLDIELRFDLDAGPPAARLHDAWMMRPVAEVLALAEAGPEPGPADDGWPIALPGGRRVGRRPKVLWPC